MNFWKKLKRPFTVLAPMEDVTDTVFRQIIAGVGRPDVFFTEFTNVEGVMHFVNTSPPTPLLSLGEGRRGEVNPVLQRLIFSKIEHPIVAQIWGTNPESFAKAAEIVRKMGFDGVDINMGCPQRKVVKNGACAALINNPTLAGEIISATREGAGGLPVSVKTRIGFNKIQTEDWCGWLLQQKLDALTIHGRTAKEMSDVPAHWDEITKIVKLRDQISPNTIIIGNGDVKSASSVQGLADRQGVDGVMIGRGVFENIDCFSTQRKVLSAQEKIDLLKKHLKLWEKTWGETRNFAIMKKFFKIYVKGWEGAGKLRAKLMNLNSISDIIRGLGEVA